MEVKHYLTVNTIHYHYSLLRVGYYIHQIDYLIKSIEL